MFKRTNRLHMERLEDRQMMAGDIHAFVNNGTLFINEADGHFGGQQTVQVTQLGNGTNGSIRVTSRTSPTNPMGSLINGKQEEVFTNVANIVTNLGAGQDFIHVIGTPSGFLAGALKINTGAPSGASNDADVVLVNDIVVSGPFEINTGSGTDHIRVLDTHASQDMTIRAGVDTPAGLSDNDEVIVGRTNGSRSLAITAGEGNDVVTVKDVEFPFTTQGGHISINTGAGADVINLGSGPTPANVAPLLGNFGPVQIGGGVHIVAGTDLQNDVDTVKLQDVFAAGHIVVELGAGNDTLDMVHVEADKFISLGGQKGNDTIKLTEVRTLDSLFAAMGEGDDTLELIFVTAKAMTLDGGPGTNDKLRRSQMPFIPSVTVRNWEEIDGKKVLTVAPGLPGLPGMRLAPF